MRKEYPRKHCKNPRSYTKFYETQAQTVPGEIFSLRRASRIKPTHWATKLLLEHTELPGTILDIGCQHGKNELIFSLLGYNVVATDISQHYLDMSKKTTREMNKMIQYHLLDIGSLENLQQEFDCTIALSVLEHVPDFDLAIQQMELVTKENGLIALCVPINKSWFTEEHVRIFTTNNLNDYFPANAKCDVIRFSDNPAALGWWGISWLNSR